jgi:SAM-dependent methyltransferase
MDFEWARELTDEQWAAALAGGDSRAPPLPSSDVQSSFVGSAGLTAYDECKIFWRLTKNHLQSSTGKKPTDETKVLDIGVGWGRFYRWLLRDVSPKNIVGVDVDSEVVDLCMTSMPYGRFFTVPSGQRYPEAPYDLAIAYSVFSHLSEAAARSTLRCARAALRPNGLMALTTLRPAHIETWAREAPLPYRGDLLAARGFDRVKWWERATDGEHLYLPTGGGSPSRSPDFFGEAVVPKRWWEHVDGFKLVTCDRLSGLPQSYIVLQAV